MRLVTFVREMDIVPSRILKMPFSYGQGKTRARNIVRKGLEVQGRRTTDKAS